MNRAVIAALLLAACSSPAETTRVRLELTFDDAWGLTRLEVATAGRSAEAPVAHVVEVLVPDEVAGTQIDIDVAGWRGDEEWATGHATVHPTLHGEVGAQATLFHVVSPGGPDGGAPDAGTSDAGTSDAGTSDAGSPDAGSPDAGCMPRTCEEAGAECGSVPDGCTGTLTCGPCTGNTFCAADGTPNKCAEAVIFSDFGSTLGCPSGFHAIVTDCVDFDTGNNTGAVCLADGIGDLDYDVIYNTITPETDYDCAAPWRDAIAGQYDCPPHFVRVCLLDE